jgi:hypothetical protein
LLINPIIRTRTRLISGVHVTISRSLCFIYCLGYVYFHDGTINSIEYIPLKRHTLSSSSVMYPSKVIISTKIARLMLQFFSEHFDYFLNFSLPDHLTSIVIIYSWGNLKVVSPIEIRNNIKFSDTCTVWHT